MRTHYGNHPFLNIIFFLKSNKSSFFKVPTQSWVEAGLKSPGTVFCSLIGSNLWANLRSNRRIPDTSQLGTRGMEVLLFLVVCKKLGKPGTPPQFHTNMVGLVQALFQLKRSFENQFWDKPYKSFTKVWTALMMVIPYPCLHAPLQERLGGAGADSFFAFGFSGVGWWTQESLQLPTNIWQFWGFPS